jgi:HTH-type transcriptional regulator/antitoxin HipB
MNYPVTTSLQLRAVLRALRQTRGLSQAQVGQLLDVNQQRVAAIELAPSVTGFDQITRFVSALGGRVVIEVSESKSTAARKRAAKDGKRQRKATSTGAPRHGSNW